MTSSKELKTFEPEKLLALEQNATERFTNSVVNVIVTVLLVVAFVPSLLNTDFYTPMWRFVTMIMLGVGYGFMGTFGMMWYEAQGKRSAAFLYFLVQLTIVFTLLSFGRGQNHNLWLLMLPLAAQGLAMGWRGAIAICVIQLVGFWIIHSTNSVTNLFNATISIGSAMLFTVLFTYIALREGSARVQIERLATDLRQANQRLAEYATQVEELATMRERNRLAREIHDNLGHYLTIVNVQIEAARTVMEQHPEKAADALQKAQRLTQEGLSSVRQSVSALRESPLGERPLAEAIRELIAETETTGIAASLALHGAPTPLDAKIELTLYRTVQEALTNARKHAQATQIDVTLDYQQPQRVKLVVSDNGRGAGSTTGGFGLLGLKERIQLLDGEFTIETAPGKGFRLLISIPTHKEIT